MTDTANAIGRALERQSRHPARPFCFVIMPFRPELQYFFLYLRQHIESTHHIECDRADGCVMTTPVHDKIVKSIRRADVIIAECTGCNPNVFYELGIAHALGKMVILITRDPIGSMPSDVRHFEFIRYTMQDHRQFLERIDNALRHALSTRAAGVPPL
jgi:hypothetical protein